jgi:hypothetical protein
VIDILANVIDRDAALRTFERYVFGDEDRLRVFDAPALAHLGCGHVRPVNAWFEPGDVLGCLLCGPGRLVVELELLPETREFPAPDALSDLPTERTES